MNLDVQNRDGWAEIQRPEELAIAKAHITDGGELVVARELVGTGQPSGHDRRLGSEGAEEKKSRNRKRWLSSWRRLLEYRTFDRSGAPPSPQSLW